MSNDKLAAIGLINHLWRLASNGALDHELRLRCLVEMRPFKNAGDYYVSWSETKVASRENFDSIQQTLVIAAINELWDATLAREVSLYSKQRCLQIIRQNITEYGIDWEKTKIGSEAAWRERVNALGQPEGM